MKVKKIDHICIAVNDLSKARRTYEDLLGLEPAAEYIAESEKINVVRYDIGEVALELMESTHPDGEVAKFLKKRGEGVFLISYKVDNVNESLKELESKGVHLIDKQPRELMGTKYAFIAPPKDLCGVLTEIIEGNFDPGQKSSEKR